MATSNESVIYYGFSPAQSQIVSESLHQKGIELVKCAPCDYRMNVYTLMAQPLYTAYCENLPAYVLATLTNTRVKLTQSWYPLPQVKEILPVPYPNVSILFKKKLSSEDNTALAPFVFSEVSLHNKDIHTFESPTSDCIATAVKIPCDRTCQVPYGSVNIESLNSYIKSVKIISAILSTHSYPAFMDFSHFLSFMPQGIETDINEKGLSSKRIRREVMELPTDENNTRDRMEDIEDSYEIPAKTTVPTLFANPSKPSKIFGTSDDIPGNSGIFFPYIADLASQDGTTVPTFFERYMLRSLGTTIEQAEITRSQLRIAWGQIGNTSSGKILTHIVKTLDTCIKAQSQCFPIFDAYNYEGCVSIGVGYHVATHKGDIKKPTDTINAIVAEYSSHTRYVKKITQICGLDEIPTSMRHLSTMVKKKPLDSDAVQTVINLACFLNFPQKYWAINPDSLEQLLILINDPTKEISVNTPLYPKYIFSTDRVELVLGAFGNNAPSFLIPASPSFTLKKDVKVPFPFKIKQSPVDAAVRDYKEMAKNHYITNAPKNLSAKHQYRNLKIKESEELWKLLVQYHAPTKKLPLEIDATVIDEEEVEGETALADEF